MTEAFAEFMRMTDAEHEGALRRIEADLDAVAAGYLNAFHREGSARLKEQLARQPKATLEQAMEQYDRIKRGAPAVRRKRADVQHIEIRRACAYYAAAKYGEHVGYGDSHQEAVADLLSEMGWDAHAVDTWLIGTAFENGEPYYVVSPAPSEESELTPLRGLG